MPDEAAISPLPADTVNFDRAQRDPPVFFTDDLLAEREQAHILHFLQGPGWKYGWKSIPGLGEYAFWHKHFAGNIQPDHHGVEGGKARQYDCSDELQRNSPLLHKFWLALAETILQGHTLVRCYANGLTYGSDGSVHTDSINPRSHTSVYYSNTIWNPNWGGETLFFDQDHSDILVASYPKPNRMVTFPGTIPHVARGVSRICPSLRITLMFKTELLQ